MKSSVLDSYAVLAFLFQEKGHERVLELFEKAAQADQTLLIAAPNWAEVRYIVERKVGAARWQEARHKLLGLPLEV
ncbi:MAG TPA: PIN domain-containing protein, partial [archaeon]|nr:PIN domain-containing protein [archaeon]